MTQSSSDNRRPFLSAPNPQRYFAAGAIEEARQRIVRSIARNEGPALLIGAAGVGKSLLLAVLAEQFAPRVAVVTLAGAQLCTRRALLQMILCELGQSYRGLDEGELRLSILRHIRGGDGAVRNAKTPAATPSPRLLLLVDEADSLPFRLLEELRVLTNVASEGLPLVSLVLAGSPILEERFADPQLDMFSQRIAARCYLAPLGREETLQYVRSQVAAAGMKPERLFTADALEAIHAATHGVPRLVNQLGDQLVWMAEETGCAPLDGALVQQAWSELQQLPAPWNTTEHPAAGSGASSSSTVEYGELDGGSFDGSDVELDDMPSSIPIAKGRAGRDLHGDDSFDATIDATELLLESLDDENYRPLTMAAPEPEPEPIEEPPASENPFDEPFDEEEIVLDPYAAIAAEWLNAAPQVFNRLDRAFAGDLQRCGATVEEPGSVKAAAKTTAPAAAAKPTATSSEPAATPAIEDVQSAQVRLHEAPAERPVEAPSYGEVLVIEDDDRPSAELVPAKQFRRLFSSLESSGARTSLR